MYTLIFIGTRDNINIGGNISIIRYYSFLIVINLNLIFYNIYQLS